MMLNVSVLPPPWLQVLDRLLLYLRVVHSIDYYNTCEYPSEDHMPNRCGMVHVRGPIPPNRITHGEGLCRPPRPRRRLWSLFLYRLSV